MKRRFVLLALPLAALTLSAATSPKARPKPHPAPAAPAPPLGDTVRIVMTTEKGPIELELDHKRAPLTVENFVRYVDLRKLDGAPFYRAMKLDWGQQPNGLIQGGLQANPLKVLKPVPHEPTSVTGISHKAGSISMARYAPGTATADFSILLSDLTSLDANPSASDPESQAGFAAFGHVVSGMDVVRAIFASPVSATKGEGVLKGQMLEPQVRILTVRRAPAPVAAALTKPSP